MLSGFDHTLPAAISDSWYYNYATDSHHSEMSTDADAGISEENLIALVEELRDMVHSVSTTNAAPAVLDITRNSSQEPKLSVAKSFRFSVSISWDPESKPDWSHKFKLLTSVEISVFKQNSMTVFSTHAKVRIELVYYI